MSKSLFKILCYEKCIIDIIAKSKSYKNFQKFLINFINLKHGVIKKLKSLIILCELNAVDAIEKIIKISVIASK